MANLIRFSNPITINSHLIHALYLTPTGELVAEVENDSIPDLNAIRFLTWDVLNDISERFTDAEYGHPYRLIDLLEQQGFMAFSEEPKLRMTIEKCISASTSMIHFGEDHVNNIVPLIPTMSEFCAIFANKADANNDAVFELMMEINDLRGVTIERTTNSASASFLVDRKPFQAMTFAIEDGESVIFFDTEPLLYHLGPNDSAPIRWYIDQLTNNFDATMYDGLVYVPVNNALNHTIDFVNTIDSFIYRAR